MTYQKYLQDENKEIFSPITSAESVYLKSSAGGGYQSLTNKIEEMTYYKPGDIISNAALITIATMTEPNVIYFPMTYLKSVDKINSASLTFRGFSRCYTDAIVDFRDTSKTYKADMVYKGYNSIFWFHTVSPEIDLPGRGVLYIELIGVNVTFT